MAGETPRVRLLKVHVQPVFVIDDGESLEELTGQPIMVSAASWRDFGENSFGPEDLEAIAAQYAAAQEAPVPEPHDATEGSGLKSS